MCPEGHSASDLLQAEKGDCHGGYEKRAPEGIPTKRLDCERESFTNNQQSSGNNWFFEL